MKQAILLYVNNIEYEGVYYLKNIEINIAARSETMDKLINRGINWNYEAATLFVSHVSNEISELYSDKNKRIKEPVVADRLNRVIAYVKKSYEEAKVIFEEEKEIAEYLRDIITKNNIFSSFLSILAYMNEKYDKGTYTFEELKMNIFERLLLQSHWL